MSIVGSLHEVDVASLVELACQSDVGVRIRINSGGTTRILYVFGGRIVHAENGLDEGEKVVFDALACTEGTFDLEKGVDEPRQSTIDLPWNALLLQGLQHLDEARGPSRVPGYTQEAYAVATKERLEDVLGEMANDLEPGLRGIGITGLDGLGIAFHKVSGEVADNLGSQMALILQLSRRASDKMEKSDVEDVLVTTEKSYILGRFMGDGSYFQVLSVERDAVLGNVRLAMRNYADRLVKAIPGAK